ncbi:MAG: multicopper oxidase domain-containing protein [Actinomycetota bacterium]
MLGAFAILVLGFFGLITAVAVLGDPPEPPPASVLAVSLNEYSITGDLTAPAGDVTLAITNTGSIEHNLVIPSLGVRSPDIAPGATAMLDLGELEAGIYDLVCDVPGHESSGMTNALTITEGGEPVVVGAHSGHGGDDVDHAAMDLAMMESMLAFPAETEGRGNPILEPTEVLADGTKVFDLTAEIVDWEVEPGRFVEAWTYNGVVPAPQIILDSGDKVKVRVLNNLPMSTDIHWHGVHTPNDQDGVAPYTQELIAPNGGTFEYEFMADDDAIGMYHAHHHAQVQVVNGMFGVIRIGENPIPRGSTISGVTIPDDLDLAVDMPMVLNDAGTIGLSLNGKSFPATEPVLMTQGEWASVTYYNEGLQIHPMHLHQFPQLVYAKDGVPLDVPYWVDTLNVAPGERYTVLFRADDAGTWVWHCHILTHVERDEGMFGMVTAIVVEPDPAFDPEASPVNPSDFRLAPAVIGGGHDHGNGDGAHDHADADADADAESEAGAGAEAEAEAGSETAAADAGA